MAANFTTLDLSAIWNAGSENTETDRGWLWPGGADSTPLQSLPSGEREFRGVPFKLGGVDGPRFAVVTQEKCSSELRAAVTIPVSRLTRRILFAHVCASVNGEFPSIDGAGEAIGAYRVTYDDGSEVVQSLRRRFEVHDVAIPWGHHPFLCRNCRVFTSVPLTERELVWGRVQTGVSAERKSDLHGWWLYDWANPHPAKTITKIEVTAAGPTPLVLGGITLCDENSDPLAWPSRTTVAVRVDEAGAPPKIDVERGVLARQDDLFVPAENFLSSEEAGWGLGGQSVGRGRYAEIHGSPEGTVTVTPDGGTAERFKWGDVLDMGSVEGEVVRVEVVGHRGTQWVHVRVEDEDTGKPVGTRVHFRSSHGAYLAPHGHQADVNVGWFEDLGGDCKVQGVPYAYIDGTCQIELPVGTAFVELSRGFEYAPIRKELEIKPGQQHLTLQMKRSFDMKSRGFYSGDTHVHFLSSQSSHLEAAAEDLNVVNLLASQWGRLFTSWEEFTGGLAPTSSDDYLIWVSQENRQHVLGHISLLGLKEMVAPMCTGGPEEDWVGGEIQTLMADWAAACHDQGGLVIMPHMPVPDFENAANIVLGQADAAEMCWVWQGEQIGQGERGYYRWLNVGQKLPIVGGTDKMSNDRILGSSRTYAKLRDDEEFTFDNWCLAVKRGTTFASTGAMIDLKVEGVQMGEELQLSGNGGTVEIEAVAESVWPLTAVELIINGVPDVREEAEGEVRRITLKHRLKTETSCWVAARCWGPYHTDAGPVMAHSSPVYLDIGGRGAFEPADGQYLLTHMEGGVSWAQQIGVFKDTSVRDRLIALFGEARRELLRRATETDTVSALFE